MNTGTGYMHYVNLASGSAMKPGLWAVNGNGVAVSNAGQLAKVGTGSIVADSISAAYIDWNASSGGAFIQNKPTLGGSDHSISFNATPSNSTFTATSNILDIFRMGALTANVTGSYTIASMSTGQLVTFVWTQDGTGGRTVAWPTNMTGTCTVDPAANISTTQTFRYDGSNAVAVGGCVNTETSFVMNQLPERTAPSNPLSGNQTFFASSTNHQLQTLDNSGNLNSLVRTSAARTAHQFVTFIPATGIPTTAAIAYADLPAVAAFSGTVSLGTTTVNTGTCSGAIDGGTATGVLATDVIIATANADPTGVTGYTPATTGGLYVWAYPTSDHVNFKLCNNTLANITPASAVTLNWKVIR